MVTVFVSPGTMSITAASKPGMSCPAPTVNLSGARPRDVSKTSPLASYYAKAGLLKSLDGMQPIDEVQKQILELLKAV